MLLLLVVCSCLKIFLLTCKQTRTLELLNQDLKPFFSISVSDLTHFWPEFYLPFISLTLWFDWYFKVILSELKWKYIYSLNHDQYVFQHQYQFFTQLKLSLNNSKRDPLSSGGVRGAAGGMSNNHTIISNIISPVSVLIISCPRRASRLAKKKNETNSLRRFT